MDRTAQASREDQRFRAANRDKVMIRIADNGVGMDQELVARILNRQIEPSGTDQRDGDQKRRKGLIWFWRSIHAGVWASNPDEGTEVLIYLPLVKERGEEDGADSDR